MANSELIHQPISPPGEAPRRPNSISLLGCRIDRVTLSDSLEWVRFFFKDPHPHQIITANPLMLLAAEKDEVLKELINKTDLVVPDAAGIVWASEQIGVPLDEVVPGIDLLQAMCALARDAQKTVYLLGGQPGVAEKTAVQLAQRFPGLRIAGTHHGYFQSREEEVAVLEEIAQITPDILFVGLSVPGQEKWIHKHLAALKVPVAMGVGGSFDVLSGRLRRAPTWMRELSLEWLYRLIQEPWRWKRMIHLPVFVWKILTE